MCYDSGCSSHVALQVAAHIGRRVLWGEWEKVPITAAALAATSFKALTA